MFTLRIITFDGTVKHEYPSLVDARRFLVTWQETHHCESRTQRMASCGQHGSLRRGESVLALWQISWSSDLPWYRQA